jgi:hypothetical protein
LWYDRHISVADDEGVAGCTRGGRTPPNHATAEFSALRFRAVAQND